ncbi:MAG: hypothetical protein R3C40_10310 [Parvularculaceae bacterium]
MRGLDEALYPWLPPDAALAGRFAKEPGRWSRHGNRAANLSAIHVFGAIFLNYQDIWPKCLTNSDPVFEVTKSMSTITRDEFGQTISDVTNWTTRDQYKVPASLAQYFQTLWRSDVHDGRPFMDWLLNDRKTNTLIDGYEETWL